MTPPKSPAGEYTPEPHPTAARLAELVAEIEALPTALRGLVAGLSDARLDTKYVHWTIRQIVHHLPDSHVNAYVRFKLALTEDWPTVKPYDETRWSELPDVTAGEVEVSLRLLEAVHARWVRVLRHMREADFARGYVHPEYGKRFTLGEAVGLYAHHGRHHAGQVAWLKRQHGW